MIETGTFNQSFGFPKNQSEKIFVRLDLKNPRNCHLVLQQSAIEHGLFVTDLGLFFTWSFSSSLKRSTRQVSCHLSAATEPGPWTFPEPCGTAASALWSVDWVSVSNFPLIHYDGWLWWCIWLWWLIFKLYICNMLILMVPLLKALLSNPQKSPRVILHPARDPHSGRFLGCVACCGFRTSLTLSSKYMLNILY